MAKICCSVSPKGLATDDVRFIHNKANKKIIFFHRAAGNMFGSCSLVAVL